MSGPPAKRSLTLRGHRTSVSLEDVFWQEFRHVAETEGKALNALASEIDETRDPEVGLASAIRVYLFERLLTQRDGPQAALADR